MLYSDVRLPYGGCVQGIPPMKSQSKNGQKSSSPGVLMWGCVLRMGGALSSVLYTTCNIRKSNCERLLMVIAAPFAVDVVCHFFSTFPLPPIPKRNNYYY